MKRVINDGQVFKITLRLKKAGIPFTKFSFWFRDNEQLALFTADTWAVKKAMHPFEGCNPSFTIWDSKIRGTALIAFRIN